MKLKKDGIVKNAQETIEKLTSGFNTIEELQPTIDIFKQNYQKQLLLWASEKLKDLARNHQILCITHLPQIAAYKDQHISVSKDVLGKTTLTSVKTLNNKESIEEIARMLSGETISPTARKHAQELVTQSKP